MFRYLRAMFRNTVVHDYIVILANIHIKLVWNFHGCWKLVNKNLKIKNYKSIWSLNTSISHTIIHICCVISKLSYENRPSFPRYDWLNAKVDCTYQSLAFNFDSIYSWSKGIQELSSFSHLFQNKHWDNCFYLPRAVCLRRGSNGVQARLPPLIVS